MIEVKERHVEQWLTCSSDSFTTLVIENPSFLREFIIALKDQIECDDGEFFYLRDGKEASLKKEAVLITDPLQVFRDEKKEETSFIKEVSGSFYEETDKEFERIKGEIISFVKGLSVYSSLPYSFDEGFTVQNLLKFLSFRPEERENSSIVETAKSISIVGHIFKKYVFFIAHLHAYYTAEEIENLFKDMANHDISLICLEHQRPKSAGKSERIIHIDHDLCEIS